jgi:hypothetical protein
MTTRMTTVAMTVAAAVVLTGAAGAQVGNREKDDLAVVKRAVAAGAQVAREPAPPVEKIEEPPTDEAPIGESTERLRRPPRAAGKEPTWLKVRVTEKGTRKGRVMVNLPLALVRAVGEGWPEIGFQCGEEKRSRCRVRISEVLAALESGQDLVEVDEDDRVVRVWVE